jgi:phytoene dehydrogenase-like protein
MTDKVDVVIIGSGAGGLSAAIALSRAGKKVVVIEQHDVPGGWSHSFYLSGHRFSPGVHYIGLVDEGGSTSKLYNGLGIGKDLTFFRMNKDAYEHCWIGDERFDIPADFELFKTRLGKRFPKEKKNISKYLDMVKEVSRQLQLIPKMDGFWDTITIPWRTRHMGKYGLFSLRRVIDWYLKDPLLKRILNVQCGDHGLPPGKASFVLHSALMSHYFEGGFYPMGGGGAIVKAMTKAIKKYDGVVRTSTAVDKIIIKKEGEKNLAKGVLLSDGTEIMADYIISNADPGITYSKLVGEQYLSTKIKNKLDQAKYSCTSLILFLVVEMDVVAAGLDSGNIWLMPNRNLDEFYNEMMTDDLEQYDAFSGMFVSCTTLKDPTTFDGRHHCLEVVTFINYDAFQKYTDEGEERSPEYKRYKESLEDKMLSGLEKVLPDVRSHIVVKELGTPITNEYYINSTRGAVYGTEKSLKHIGPFAFSSKTEIENLYMCGASVLSHGVAGAGHSGVDTAARILNCKPTDLLVNDTGQKVRILEAEDDTNYPADVKTKIETRRKRSMSQKAI